VAAVVITVFSANFVSGTTASAFPTSLSRSLGDAGTIATIAGVSLAFLALIAATMTGFGRAYYGVREFFADVIPAVELGQGLYPFAAAPDEKRRGTWLAGWAMPPPAPDRIEHLLGNTPRTGALIAFAVAYWVALRTLILTLDPRSPFGFVWVFDLVTLATVVSMLIFLPRRTKNRIDYGCLPWLATATVTSGLVIAAWNLVSFTHEYLRVDVPSSIWLSAVAFPPLAVVAILASCTLLPARRCDERAPPPFDRPRLPGSPGRAALNLLACPAIVVSITSATLPVYVFATLVTGASEAIVYARNWNSIRALDIVALVILGPFLVLVLKNLYFVSRLTGWLEAGLTCLLLGLVVGALASLAFAQSEAARTEGARALDFGLVLEMMARESVTLLLLSALGTLVAALVLVPSWWARLSLALSRPSDRS
jgi:hypothetical protein